MSSSPGLSQTSQFAPPANDAAFEDVFQGGSFGDHDSGPLGLGYLPLKRHPSQELESHRPPKLSRVAPDIFLPNEDPSLTMSMELVDSADQFLGDFIVSVLTYPSVKQEHDHGTPQAADRAAELCNSFLTVFRNPTRCQHFLNYRGEHLQTLIDTMQSLLDDGYIDQKLRTVFLRIFATLSGQSQLYPTRFLLHGVADWGVKLPYSRTTKGSMEGNAVCIKKMPDGYDLKDTLRKTMLWAQLSHENVLPFYGLCKIGDDPLPRLVFPFLENGAIIDFLRRNPDSDRRSFVCDIAAGMSYLHDNKLYYTGISSDHILVTSAVPPRACLAHFSFSHWQDNLWSNDYQNMTFTDVTDSEHSGSDLYGAEDVGDFSTVALEILAYNAINDDPEDYHIFFQGQHPPGYLYDRLDESMWQLLKDCYEEEFEQRPTACQIVERLQDGKEQWEMALAAQKHEMNTIVKSAMTYVSLKQDPDKITQAHAATQASALYDSFRNIFRDLGRYEHLINCRGEGVQVLIDSIQSVSIQFALLIACQRTPDPGVPQLLDNGFVEQKFRNTFILVLATLARRSQLCPQHFRLHGLIDQKVKVGDNLVKASLGGKVVCDVAAGISYLHDNGLILRSFDHHKIGVTSTVPPHACLINFDYAHLEPAWVPPDLSDDAKMKFSEMQSWKTGIHTAHNVFNFSTIAFQILTGEPGSVYKRFQDGRRLGMPVGYLNRGLDEPMWQLLLDCQMKDLNLRPTTCQLVEWLSYPEAQKKQTRLRIAKKQEKVIKLLSATCASIQHYKSLLSCNNDDAQTLLDKFQLLLDTGFFKERNQLVAAIKTLSGPAKQFPHRFFLGPVPNITDYPVASGGFADVYKVNFQGEVTCLKVIRLYGQSQVEHLAKVYAKEAIVWAQLSHPNILPFYGLALSPLRLAFVTRWATQGDLTQYLKQNPGTNGILLCKDTAVGVEYLHTNDIVHGDLKGCNVLIDSSGRASLCDFGLASVTDPKIIKWTSQSTMASKGGTTRWQAPELHESEDTAEEVYNTKATDVFAWAGVCYEIFTGCLPFFEIPHPITIMSKIVQGHIPTCPEHENAAWQARGLNERVWNLMKECWHFKPSTRPDMTQILLKLAAENVTDTRPPPEWEKDASMRFRNSQDSKESDNVNSMLFWEDLEGLLLRLVPGIKDMEIGSEASV
ncbi:hypothetical protein DXG01_009039 [Tephrocybe rancida]|nr:hypothetical protein DXG01_009039 [Tephrocybe rancida]